MLYQASAPGSLILFGEYAVLYDKKAVVAAIDKIITVTLIPRHDQKVIIHSDLGYYETDLKNLRIESPFEFILASLLFFKTSLSTGCDIHVKAEFTADLGLGSSAAVTVATCRCLIDWLVKVAEPVTLLEITKTIIQTVQGRGSGADAAASLYGGVISYQMQNTTIEKLADYVPFRVFYSGKKLTTTQALQKIKRVDVALINQINAATVQAINAIKAKQFDQLSEIAKQAQAALLRLNISTPVINELIQWIETNAKGSGAKISGSGFGDCIIAFSASKMNNATLPQALLSAGVKELFVLNGEKHHDQK